MNDQNIIDRPDQQGADLIGLTAQVVSSFLSNNSTSTNDVPVLIGNVHAAFAGLGAPAIDEQPKQEPAVSIRASVKPDYLVCLEDGKKLKMLKRHLMTHYNLTPDEYRKKWGLNADYPMVAPNYAEQRRVLAKKIGLGTLRTRADATPARGRAASGNGGTTARGGRAAKATGTGTGTAAKRGGAAKATGTTGGRGRRKASASS